jgi:16S rRNA (cytosine967-C5)-methyltransferase
LAHDTARAATILVRVTQGESLTQCLAGNDTNPTIQHIAYGVLREYYSLSAQLGTLLKKQLRERDADIQVIMLVGLYRLGTMRTPDHAAVNECVNAVPRGKSWARGLVNGVLRSFLRATPAAGSDDADPEARWNHPQWLIDRIRRQYADGAPAIFDAANQHPPMHLRVNRTRVSRSDYQLQLAAQGIEASPVPDLTSALTLDTPYNVDKLPGFAEGLCAIQDVSSQYLEYLVPDTATTLLDACAAPGGKTALFLESRELLVVTAVDISVARCEMLTGNLQRLGLTAQVHCEDLLATPAPAAAAESPSGPGPEPITYDVVVLDAPCSATGVIRRHPDIKLLRRDSDVAKLAATQLAMLHALWPRVRKGGQLIYATCSILAAENQDVVARFLAHEPSAVASPFALPGHEQALTNLQLLPTPRGPDGFFFARLEKCT